MIITASLYSAFLHVWTSSWCTCFHGASGVGRFRKRIGGLDGGDEVALCLAERGVGGDGFGEGGMQLVDTSRELSIGLLVTVESGIERL